MLNLYQEMKSDATATTTQLAVTVQDQKHSDIIISYFVMCSVCSVEQHTIYVVILQYSI